MGERDVTWDTLEELMGPVRTPSERGRRNKAVAELKAALATPDEIRRAYSYCKGNFTQFSEMALITNFSLAQQASSDELEDAIGRMLGDDH
jgi:hypothetical protein